MTDFGHELLYAAGLAGSTEPRWYCRCENWQMPARAMARRRTGNNRREAELAWDSHAAAQPGTYGAGPGYN